jgi:acyl carrier protein
VVIDNGHETFVAVLRRRLKYLDAGEPLDLNRDLKSLGLDSMAAVDLLFDIEDAFHVTLPDELLVAETFSTATTLYETLCSLKKEGVGQP